MLMGLMIVVSGCAVVRNRRTEIYPYSYDHTYNRVLAASQSLKDWTLTGVDYRHGKAKLSRGGFYFKERFVEITVQSLDPSRTQVEFRGTGVPLLKKQFFKKMDQEFSIDAAQAV